MSYLQGKNMVMYGLVNNEDNGGQDFPFVCGVSWSLEMQATLLPTKHKTSGKAQTYIHKDYGGVINVTLVYDIGTDSEQQFSGDALLGYLTKQEKFLVKLLNTSSENSTTYICRVLVENVALLSAVGDVGRASATLRIDGDLYYTSNADFMPDNFGEPSIFKRTSTTTESSFSQTSNPNLIGRKILMVAKNKELFTTIQISSGSPSTPGANTTVDYYPTGGTFTFTSSYLLNGDEIEIFYV